MQVQRSKSFNHSQIERMLDIDPTNVIGDFTKVSFYFCIYIAPFKKKKTKTLFVFLKAPALPTVSGRHQELKYITPEIVSFNTL